MMQCDRCGLGVVAVWAFTSPVGTLLFCNHHAMLHRDTLLSSGWHMTHIGRDVPAEATV
jgi:hypothetical protein